MFKTIASKLTVILITVALLATTACVKGKPGIPNLPLDPKSISAGVVTSLQGIVTILTASVSAGQTNLQPELDAAKKILASATVVNNTIQTGNGNLTAAIASYGQDATAIAAVFGADSDLVTAINLGISIFTTVANAFGLNQSPTVTASASPQAENAPQETLQVRAAKLDAIRLKYQKRSKP